MAVELASPLWLAGAALVPVLYWLHRYQGSEHTVVVSALFLWPRGDSGGGKPARRQRPPPVWMLRALIGVLVAVALAGPTLVDPRPAALTVWLDESVSLRTVQNGRTRMAAALDQLATALAVRQGAEVTVRSLADPARSLALPAGAGVDAADVISTWSSSYTGEPRAPLPALARRDREHWLVTDGASPGIDDWLVHWPFSRVVTAGTGAANVGIAGLSLRRSAPDAGAYTGIVELHNAGIRPAKRDVRLSGDGRPLADWTVEIPPEDSLVLGFEVAQLLPQRLTARMTPGDALGADDILQLDTSALTPVAYEVGAACPAIVPAALGAHPGLTRVATGAAFVVQCSATDPADERPRLIVAGNTDVATMAGPLQWAGASGGSMAPVAVHARPVERRGRVVASVSGFPVVVQTATNPAVLHAALDFSRPGNEPVAAELLTRLIATLLDREVLDVVASARAAGPASIAPRPLARQANPADSARVPATVAATPLAGWLAALACLLVLADVVLVVQAGTRSSPRAHPS